VKLFYKEKVDRQNKTCPKTKQAKLLEVTNELGQLVSEHICNSTNPFITGDEPYLLGVETPYNLITTSTCIALRFSAIEFFSYSKMFSVKSLSKLKSNCTKKCKHFFYLSDNLN
jgi:hypothetical protein